MADASTTAAQSTEVTNGAPQAKDAASGKEGKEVVAERRILPAMKPDQSHGFFSTLLGLILLMPMKVLTLVGLYRPKKRALVLSGQPLIDSSSLKPLADDAPEKRKHVTEVEEQSTEDDTTEDEDMQGVEEDPYKYLRDEVEYDSQEDEDYKLPADAKPADEDNISDEYEEGLTDEDDVNIDPNDIIKTKTRTRKAKGEPGEILPEGTKGEEKTGPIELEKQAVNEEKSK